MRINTINRPWAKLVSLVFAVVLALSFMPSCNLFDLNAFAETNNINAEPDEFQIKIEESSKLYDEASKEAASLQAQIDENQSRIDEINETIPEQQERADVSMRELYSINTNLGMLVNAILGVESISDAIDSYNYLEHIRSKNVEQVRTLTALKEELDVLQSGLSAKKASADAKAQEAATSLKQAQEAREEAQRKAQEKAAAEKAALEAAQAKEQANGGSTVAPTSDNVNWSTDKESFVNEWAGRIDNYLSGSPLGGQGRVFAEAAWDYGVDPRWSPAISNTESSKGRYCFRSYNAWGWGNISWSSWDEAIRAHVRGLANGYGYTISMEAARKYCPPNAEHWYYATAAQMNMI